MSETSSRLRLTAATTNLHPDDRQLLNDAADELQALTARIEAAERALTEVTEELDRLAAAKWITQYADTMNDMVLLGMARDDADARCKAALARIATIERETLERAAEFAHQMALKAIKQGRGDFIAHEIDRDAIRAMIEEKTDE